MYQSLANLIRWSDQVMLEGVNSEDKEVVTAVKGVIKAVLDGVKVRAGLIRRGEQPPHCVWLTGELVPKPRALTWFSSSVPAVGTLPCVTAVSLCENGSCSNISLWSTRPNS